SSVQGVPIHAEWNFIGPVTASSPRGNGITLRNSRAVVGVTALAPDLIRVRMTPGNSSGSDDSYAVIKKDWPRTAVEFAESAGSRIMQTPEIEVRLQLAPFRVAFYDRAGRLVAKDDDGLGTAWDGGRVRCWKWMPPDEHYFGLGEKSDGL